MNLKRWIIALAKEGLGYEDIWHRLNITKESQREDVRAYYFEIAGKQNVDGTLLRMRS